MTLPSSKRPPQKSSAHLADATAIADRETQDDLERLGELSAEQLEAEQVLVAGKPQSPTPSELQSKPPRGSKFKGKFKSLKAKFGKEVKDSSVVSPVKDAQDPEPIDPEAKQGVSNRSAEPTVKPIVKPNAVATQSVEAERSPSTSLNAHELVLGWFKAYPGLWLSPLVLGILGGWVIAQPEPEGAARVGNSSLAAQTGDPSLPPFVYREAAPLGPVSPFSESEPSTVADEGTAGSILSDPPDATARAKAELKQRALEQAAQANGNPGADLAANPAVDLAGNSGIASALPGVPPAGTSEAETALANQLEARAASAAQAQAAADAKFALEERAKAQAAAFAQAQANQAASSTPPQPAPAVQGNPAVDQLITMQVAIAEGDTTLSMGGSSQGVIMTQAGEPLLQLEAGNYGMQCDGAGLVLNGQTLPATVMMAPLGGGLNYVRDRSYRGQIQFICQGDTVLAVNHIDMLQYLYSVVGSEVSASWPAAALKAQSVAARSYALTYYFRPAKEHFHIGDTESYQVYKGTVSEDDRVKAAVQATAGEFISYDGGIVESLYAASDDIVMEAFQGGGMSQLGALDFAEQGYNYLQILGYYYPQTSLGRMVIEGGA